MGIGYRRVKLCHVCYSPHHLIKDCDFHDKKSKQVYKHKDNSSKAVLSQSTAQPKYSKPIWNTARRVNHENFSKKNSFPHQKQYFKPKAVLSNKGLQSTAKPFYPQMKSVKSKRPYYSSYNRYNNYYKYSNVTKRSEVQNSAASSHAVLPSKRIQKRKFVKIPLQEWRPKGLYLDHVHKDNGNYTIKAFDYETPQGQSKSVMAWIPKRN